VRMDLSIGGLAATTKTAADDARVRSVEREREYRRTLQPALDASDGMRSAGEREGPIIPAELVYNADDFAQLDEQTEVRKKVGYL